MMHRFYVDENRICRNEAELNPEDAQHAIRVLRLRPGAEAEIITGGLRYRAVLKTVENNIVVFCLKKPLPLTESRLRITLFQGLPKADKMEWIVQKAVEIGVVRIVPVIMTRCMVKLNPNDALKKQERWQRIAREAGKQSGRCMIPEVSLPCSLEKIISFAAELDACMVPWEETGTLGPKAFMASHSDLSSLGILIGPEGGIDPREIDLLAGFFQPVTLGPRILRTETAGLVTAAAVLALSGEMEQANR